MRASLAGLRLWEVNDNEGMENAAASALDEDGLVAGAWPGDVGAASLSRRTGLLA